MPQDLSAAGEAFVGYIAPDLARPGVAPDDIIKRMMIVARVLGDDRVYPILAQALKAAKGA